MLLLVRPLTEYIKKSENIESILYMHIWLFYKLQSSMHQNLDAEKRAPKQKKGEAPIHDQILHVLLLPLEIGPVAIIVKM